MSSIIPGIMNQPCQTFWVVGYPRQTPFPTTPTRWPRWAWKWKKWTQLQMSSRIPCFFSQKVLELTTLVFPFSERVDGFVDSSCTGTTIGRVSSFLLLEEGTLLVLALWLVERHLLISCWFARGLLLGHLDEAGLHRLPLKRLQGKIGIFKGFL